MSQEETRGKAEQIKGRVKEAVGIVTGNRELEQQGAQQRAAGAVREGVGSARRKIGELVEDVADAIKK